MYVSMYISVYVQYVISFSQKGFLFNYKHDTGYPFFLKYDKHVVLINSVKFLLLRCFG